MMFEQGSAVKMIINKIVILILLVQSLMIQTTMKPRKWWIHN